MEEKESGIKKLSASEAYELSKLSESIQVIRTWYELVEPKIREAAFKSQYEVKLLVPDICINEVASLARKLGYEEVRPDKDFYHFDPNNSTLILSW